VGAGGNTLGADALVLLERKSRRKHLPEPESQKGGSKHQKRPDRGGGERKNKGIMRNDNSDNQKRGEVWGGVGGEILYSPVRGKDAAVQGEGQATKGKNFK